MKESNPNEFQYPNIDKVKYPDMAPDLLHVAERMEVALEEFDGFQGDQGYFYEDGVVTFNLTNLSEKDLALLIEKISQSVELTKNFETNISDDNEEKNTLLTIKKKQYGTNTY